jgi:hypothetical protein
MDKRRLISFIRDVGGRPYTNNKGEVHMTQQLAMEILKMKDVYLTSEGKEQLVRILNGEGGTSLEEEVTSA